ncbi:MAG: glycosyltransferase family 2 protein [Thermosynechococcaceae cyanobacterium]
MPSLDIVIVNWNTGHQLFDCLSSILTTDRSGFHLNNIVIIDNASTDTSMLGIKYIDLPLKIRTNSFNRGFGAACNQGALESNADYILFLNPDTSLFENSLCRPIEFMQEDNSAKVGICGIQLVDSNSEVSHTCTYFPTFTALAVKALGLNALLPHALSMRLPKIYMTDWDYSYNRQVDQVIGAFFLIRRDLFERLEGFDERFFVYFEEVDLSFRALKQGWTSYYLSDVRAFHRGNGSSEQVKAHRLFYSLRSRIKYGYKHFNYFSATSLALISLTLEPWSRISLVIAKRSYAEIPNIIFAYYMLFKDLIQRSLKALKITH